MKNHTLQSLWIAALFAAFASAPGAQAAPIVSWDLAGATGQQAAVLFTAANVTASSIDEVGVNEWTSTARTGLVAARDWPSSLTYDPGRYYQWTVTAAAGFQVAYDTIDLALFRGIWGGGHGADQWDLRASNDGFGGGSNVGLGTFDISASGIDEQTQFVGHDISALGAQTGTVTFRLYGYNQTQAGDYSGLGNSSGWVITGTGLDPVISGTASAVSGPASVPEPPPGLLAAFGLLGLLAGGTRRS